VLSEPATSKWLLMRGPVLSFFFFLGVCCHAMKFPKGSPSSQVVHQNVPNSTSLISHMVCPKFNSHVYKCKKVGHMEHICFILQLAVQRGCFYFFSPFTIVHHCQGVCGFFPSTRVHYWHMQHMQEWIDLWFQFSPMQSLPHFHLVLVLVFHTICV